MFHVIEVPKKMKLTDLTKKALRKLKKHDYVNVERDDSPEGYQTFEQLKDICGAVGYEIIENGYCMTITGNESSVS